MQIEITPGDTALEQEKMSSRAERYREGIREIEAMEKRKGTRKGEKAYGNRTSACRRGRRKN